MQQNKYGKIVFMTTQYTEQMPSELLHYITAKSALNGFAKALAVELAPKGIRVNLVSAGMANTNLISDIPEKVKLITAARTPLRRLAEPQDVADAISYLISEKSDFLTDLKEIKWVESDKDTFKMKVFENLAGGELCADLGEWPISKKLGTVVFEDLKEAVILINTFDIDVKNLPKNRKKSKQGYRDMISDSFT